MARSSLPRRLGAATLLTSMVLSAAACGGDDTSATDTASGETSAEDSEQTEDTGDTEVASGDLAELSAEEFYPAVTAALKEAETMGFTVSTTGGPAPLELTGQLRYEADGIEMSAATSGAQAFEMVMLDKILYIAGAGMPLPDGKKWLKVDLSDPNSLFGQLGKSTDPSAMFKAMEAPKEFELLGTEEVDGVETNHYNVVMETASYAKAMELPTEMMQAMPKEIVIEMWVDADNQPRKFRQELELPDMTGSGQKTKTTTEGTYFDFGSDVDISAPPAAEIADNVPGMS
ncbi:MAG: hypothetical protein JWN68_1597 [Nocardioides sp.]|uniref:hypothetical protein n=1 Tax=Nocardioides sp. TaxID=35761 RepID=UPI0026271DC2|nr:hypothetical protein [Nocardioides sp.]MCW2833644.1 hypothetical protein [Nocardioides sp.]